MHGRSLAIGHLHGKTSAAGSLSMQAG